ncbi:AraC family transcriptional regulator [Teredinibacter sp. KSP-S5-2]|uniref:AraC family transcriptional regulator n=1 Tax=Teredinibacter sp. KSP-S5-2 TaxID=3034506 RepID=UPI002934AA50|nr:AraC family transcriptional regulator [Teredinibacter sp. KSP-S5-2]WNO09172.1 AraC family transcriptional regulator [Teredinibacter sp. KSP-S5-2]
MKRNPLSTAQPEILPVNDFGLKLYLPLPSLSQSIQHIWYCGGTSSNTGFTQYLTPNGGLGIIINIGSPIWVDNEQLKQGVYFDSTFVQSQKIQLPSNCKVFGIRFFPGEFKRCFPLPVCELRKGLVDTSSIYPDTEQLLTELTLASCRIKQIVLIENWLYSLICRFNYSDVALRPLLSKLRANYSGKISKLIDSHTGLSQRSLERRFKSSLGMSIKEYLDIQRFNTALKTIRQKPEDLSQVALSAGYYDQSHFSRQFKRVMNITPGQYLQRFLKSRSGNLRDENP